MSRRRKDTPGRKPSDRRRLRLIKLGQASFCDIRGMSSRKAAEKVVETLHLVAAEKAIFQAVYQDRESRETAIASMVDEHVRRIENSSTADGPVMILCRRVGTGQQMPQKERCELTQCERCGSPLWITSRIKEAIARKGMRLVAICIERCSLIDRT
jgi:hypothetical protein